MTHHVARRSSIGLPASIVIPALNEERHLPRLLTSLAACGTRPLDVIVVDGRSDDRTVERVEAFRRAAPDHMQVRCLTSPVRNVAAQRNLGASAARHDILLFLDADTAVESPADLDALIEAFQEGGFVAAGCRLRPLERDPRAILYYDVLYVFHRALARWDPYACGSCIVTTRDTFRRCSGFDPTVRVNEDAHFCRRAARMGRFGILPVAIGVSTRRFAKHGYLRMGLTYLRIYLDRVIRGEVRDDRIRYEFGHYD